MDFADAVTHTCLCSHNSPGWTYGTNFEKLASILHLLATRFSGMSAHQQSTSALARLDNAIPRNGQCVLILLEDIFDRLLNEGLCLVLIPSLIMRDNKATYLHIDGCGASGLDNFFMIRFSLFQNNVKLFGLFCLEEMIIPTRHWR